MISAKAHYIWILFNKQDLLPLETRTKTLSNLHRKFSTVMTKYDGKVLWNVVDQPGLSSVTGEGLHGVLDDISKTLLRDAKSSKPLGVQEPAPPKAPSPEESKRRAEVANSTASNTGMFWQSFLQSDLLVWDHYNHLRAGYFILIDTLANGDGVLQCAETFLGHLERLKSLKPERAFITLRTGKCPPSRSYSWERLPFPHNMQQNGG